MKISKEKRERIAEQVLAALYSNSPSAIFTSHVAKEVARDEEFTKKILKDLKKKKLVTEVKKNPDGEPYKRRTRWRLSDEAYKVYKKQAE